MRWLGLFSLMLVVCAGCRRSAVDHLTVAAEAIYRKDPQRALSEYRQALEALGEDQSPAAMSHRAQALRGAADLYRLDLSDKRQAIAVYRELIAQCPESPESVEGRVVLADLLREHAHDLRGAIDALSGAIARRAPQSDALSYRVAAMYFELADYQQSALEAQQLVTRFPDSAAVDDALFLQGQALSMMEGRRNEAKGPFEELLKRFPDSELWPHALYELGKLRAEGGDNEGAIDAWVKALPRHPQPQVVQSSIRRVRRRIAATTPKRIGDVATAFESAPVRRVRTARPARTSVEAAGGTAEEAARDRGD